VTFLNFRRFGRRNRFVCSIDFWQLRKMSQTLSEAQDLCNLQPVAEVLRGKERCEGLQALRGSANNQR
jgi:hypothetical protein